MTHPSDKAWNAWLEALAIGSSLPLMPSEAVQAFRAGWDAAMAQRTKRAAFAPPSPADVSTYALSTKCPNIPKYVMEFMDYYESCGWSVGKKPMKDWKAAFRRWVRSPFNQQPQSQEMRSVNR